MGRDQHAPGLPLQGSHHHHHDDDDDIMMMIMFNLSSSGPPRTAFPGTTSCRSLALEPPLELSSLTRCWRTRLTSCRQTSPAAKLFHLLTWSDAILQAPAEIYEAGHAFFQLHLFWVQGVNRVELILLHILLSLHPFSRRISRPEI